MRPGPQRRLEVFGEIFLDLQRHRRRALVQRRNQVRQQVRRDGVDHAEPEQADQLVASRLRDVADAGRFLQDLLRLLDDALADRRDRHLVLAALENLRAQLLLELLDRDRQRRLADEAMLRCPPEIAFLCDGDDVAKLVEGHRVRLRIFGERGADFGVLQRQLDRRLQVAELVAAVVAAALEFVAPAPSRPRAAARCRRSAGFRRRRRPASCADGERCAASAYSGRPRPASMWSCRAAVFRRCAKCGRRDRPCLRFRRCRSC